MIVTGIEIAIVIVTGTAIEGTVIAIGIAVTLLCLYGSTNVDSILTFAPTMTLALLTPALVIRRLAALRGEQRLITPDGAVKELPGCFSVTVQLGDVIEIKTPGGGGFGSRAAS